MIEKKIDKEDLNELKEKTKLINQFIYIAQALEAQKQAYIVSKFSKYGLDGTKAYDIDLNTGKIKEIKETKPKVEK